MTEEYRLANGFLHIGKRMTHKDAVIFAISSVLALSSLSGAGEVDILSVGNTHLWQEY